PYSVLPTPLCYHVAQFQTLPLSSHSNLPFFFNTPAPTTIYTLSLHDALPIYNTNATTIFGTLIQTKCPFLVRLLLSSTTREPIRDRKSTRLNSSHVKISYAVFCLKKKKEK